MAIGRDWSLGLLPFRRPTALSCVLLSSSTYHPARSGRNSLLPLRPAGLPGRRQLGVPVRPDGLGPPGQLVGRGDVPDGAVQADVVVVVHESANLFLQLISRVLA